MSDRWDDEDELGRERDRLRGREREREPTLGELIDSSVRKVVTAIFIAGGLIALGAWSGGRGGGGDPSPDFQITADGGRIYRVSTERGRIVACEGTHCWEVLDRGDELKSGPPPAPAPATAPAQPQAVTAQPAPAQLPAPQNTQAPATR